MKKAIILVLLCIILIMQTVSVTAEGKTEDSFAISEEEIQKIENAYNSYDWENEYGDSHTDIKINSEKVLKAYSVWWCRFSDGRSLEEASAAKSGSPYYIFESEQLSGEIMYVSSDSKGDFSYNPSNVEENKEWCEILYKKGNKRERVFIVIQCARFKFRS